MRTLLSFAALMLSVAFVQLGSGSLGPLDALAGAAVGFSNSEIGLLGSAHYVGFFIGCWAAPPLMGSVGHARGFAAIAAIGAIAALAHPLVVDPVAWAVLRIGSGASIAGAYAIVESWLQASVTNESRGRVFSAYRVVDMTASIAAQGLVAVLEPGSYVAYNIIAMLCCLCLIPLTLTRRTPPPATSAPRLRPLRTLRTSPLGAVSVIIVGLTSSSFRMVGPIYAVENGLETRQVAAFMAAGVAGGALAQWPVGWLSDKFDRRRVLVMVSALACLVCTGVAAGIGAESPIAVYASAFLFGAAAFPLYSVASAHANDFAKPEEVVELNASLLFMFAVGAIVSPIFAAELISVYGPPALFVYVALAHVFLIGFSLWRMTRRPAQAEKTPHRYLPRTSFLQTKLFPGRR